MLETFRLPGEAPLIATIVESFSAKYCSPDNAKDVVNKDGVFILTYAIILLNTDQHNPNVKNVKRMTLDDFARNLRGQNDGGNFAPEYLKEIYESIKTNEIILPEEHDNKHAFDYAWRELLLKTETAGPLVVCDTNIYDADMFATTWKPIVSTLSYVFMSATDDAVFARIVTGFDECARIAAKYGNTEALDQIVYCLSRMTTLDTDQPFNTSLNTEVQVGESSVMVSELAVKLGRNFRAQLATLVLFRVVTGNEAHIDKSWNQVIRIWLNLFVNSLIPSYTASHLATVPVPTIPLQSPSQVIDRGARTTDTGFFSAFTSYISSYAADDPPEPSDEELESTLCTIDCINSCKLEDVFANIAKLQAPVLTSLVEGLLDQIPEDDQAAVISVKQDGLPSPPANGMRAADMLPTYDPAVVYSLELCTQLAIRDAEAVGSLGKQVFDLLQGILRDPSRWHAIIVSRATFYGLIMLKASYDHDFINVPYLLHSISSLPHDILIRGSDLVLDALANCISEPGSLRNEMMTSPDFWATLRILMKNADSVARVFSILEKGTTGSPPAIMADNYEVAVSLLNDFASAAGTPNTADSKADIGQRKPEQPKSAKGSKEAIERGCKAVNMLQDMTLRIPQLMQQSHLESSEGMNNAFPNSFRVY
jgi:brefeldin A-resistance guanine nucleotide exchange factor 1